MDYKELIESLRTPNFVQSQRNAAADAIETLLAERDAAVEELRGICWCCTHGRKWEKAPVWSKMTTCEHLKEIGVLARSGGKTKCPYWEWRGAKGDAANDG